MFASDLASFGHICAIHQEWAWNFPDFQFSKPFQPSLRIHQAQHRHRRLQRGGRRGAGSTGLAAGSAGAAGRGTARIGGVVGDAGNSHESSRCLGMRRLADTQWFHVLNLNLADFFWLSEKYITQLPVYALPVPWSCMYPFKRYVIHIHIYIYIWFHMYQLSLPMATVLDNHPSKVWVELGHICCGPWRICFNAAWHLASAIATKQWNRVEQIHGISLCACWNGQPWEWWK